MTSVEPQKPPPSPRGPILFLVAAAAIGLFVGVGGQEWRWRNSAPPPSENLKLAEAAFQKGDDKAALTLFSKLVDQKNATAEYWLAHMSELGLGVPRDPARAVALYKEAADQNVVAAEVRLGEIYLNGDLVLPDSAQAKNYLEKAAYHGNARAAMLVGQMYRIGIDTPADATKAYAWSEVATIEGSAFAQSERDSSLHDLDLADQQAGIARAHEILDQIKATTTPTVPPTLPASVVHTPPSAAQATQKDPPSIAAAQAPAPKLK
jgi:hypothetical protein